MFGTHKEGRHVGLDFYDLLIEGDYTNYDLGAHPRDSFLLGF